MVNLREYITEYLTPSRELKRFLNSKSESIKQVQWHSTGLSVREVRPGGSYEKDTMLKDHPDVDIVFILNKSDKQHGIAYYLNFITEKLRKNFPFIHVKKGEHHSVHLEFEYEGQKINFDVVPSYYNTDPFQNKKGDELYRGTTTILHLEYFNIYKDRPCFLDVVMLLKNWRNNNDLNKLKSLHIELLTAFVYGRYSNKCKDLHSILKLCFCKIQAMIDGKPIVPVNWPYFQKVQFKRRYENPTMIDPANKDDNLLEVIPSGELKNIKRVACKAISYMDQEKFGKIFDPNNLTHFFQ